MLNGPHFGVGTCEQGLILFWSFWRYTRLFFAMAYVSKTHTYAFRVAHAAKKDHEVLLPGGVYLRAGSGGDHYVGQYDRWVNDMFDY